MIHLYRSVSLDDLYENIIGKEECQIIHKLVKLSKKERASIDIILDDNKEFNFILFPYKRQKGVKKGELKYICKLSGLPIYYNKYKYSWLRRHRFAASLKNLSALDYVYTA